MTSVSSSPKPHARNIAAYVVSFLSSVIGVGLNLFLARALQATVYGRIQYFVALATTCANILLFGLNSFLVREASNEAQQGQATNKCLTLYLAIAATLLPLMFVVLYFWVPQSAHNIGITLIVLAAAFFFGATVLLASHFQGKGKYHLSVLLENLVPRLVLLAVSVLLVLLAAKQWLGEYYLVFFTGVYGLAAIPCFFLLFRKFNLRFSREELKSIAFFFGVTMTYSIGTNLTKVLQGALYQNDIALAIISVSISIGSLVRIFTAVMDNVLKPIFAKQKRENDIDGLLQTYRFGARMNAYVAVPLYLFFIFNSVKFLSFFGDSYLAYPIILSLIAGANFIGDITGPTGIMLAMIGKEKWELFNGFLYFGVYLLCVFAFSYDPIYGLSLALLVAQTAVIIAKYIEVWVVFKCCPLDWKTMVTLIIVTLVDFLAIFFLKYIPGFWLWLGIGIFVGLSLLAINLFVLSFYRKTDFRKLLSLRL